LFSEPLAPIEPPLQLVSGTLRPDTLVRFAHAVQAQGYVPATPGDGPSRQPRIAQ
jgi:hypothetical protein